ncbi:MAG: carbamoyltransferase HypF [bacterium]
MTRLRLTICGRVQGVGFRPTIYRTAKRLKLRGWIKNTTEGVSMEIEGNPDTVDYFLKNLKKFSPPHAKIKNISTKKLPPKGYISFKILKSALSGKNYISLPPDISVCDTCKNELFTTGNRRFCYPFINCTNCGPRFSITHSVPYDRINTTMSDFKMCPNCQKEFDNPMTRRFHAQPNACPICGPKVCLTNVLGKKINCLNPIEETTKLLKRGKILAIKGIGGFHLCCNALNTEAVMRLRKRKERPDKPLAIMCPDIKTAEQYCFISQKEKDILLSNERPIVLLGKRNNLKILEGVAPKNKYLGIMLPYTPLHSLLFYPPETDKLSALVMTSGNRRNEPISRTNNDAYKELKNIADYFLLHNREIFNRCDDSIACYSGRSVRLLRRARGYVPNTVGVFPKKKHPEIFASGADMKNSLALFTKGRAFLSQYIGELKDERTMSFFEEIFVRLKKLTGAKPEKVLYDLHPEYLSANFAKQYARQNSLKSFGIQHHQAHIASVACEEDLKPPFIGVAFDGTGYGMDGNIWGGDFFAFTKDKILRTAHLDYFYLPGGELAIKEIWRIAAVLCEGANIDFIDKKNKEKIDIIRKMAQTKTNTPLTSSMGRLFDAVAALLSLRNEVTFEAQAAMELESLCKNKPKSYYPICLKNIKANNNFESKEKIVIDAKSLFLSVVEDKKNNVPNEKISEKFHLTIVKLISEISGTLAQTYNTDKILLSGGVFQNRILVDWLTEEMDHKKLKIYFNKLVPANDAGISIGQVWIYLNYIANKKI